MQNSKLYNAIGLCMKAGKAQSGAFSVEKAIKGNKAKLVLVENGASDLTKSTYTALCGYYKIPIHFVESVGDAIGKPGRVSMAVMDEPFQKMIEGLLAQE